MVWVKTFAEKEAPGRLAEVYAELMKHALGGGRVPNIMSVWGCGQKPCSASGAST